MYDEVSLGHWLKQQRKARDLTQADLARLVGCAAITIRKIESGTLRPSRQVAERLADTADVIPAERAGFVAWARGITRSILSDLRCRPPPFGRTADIAAVRNLLLDADVRLLTLTGPPGVGKTRQASKLRPFSSRFSPMALKPWLWHQSAPPAWLRRQSPKRSASKRPPDDHIRRSAGLSMFSTFCWRSTTSNR